MKPPVSEVAVRVEVNGVQRSATVEVRRTLADFLRENLGLTGTHVGCEHGVCGACTVLLDGVPVRACLTFAAQVNGASITTVEGLATDGRLHPLQTAFKAHHALQCGFCTPGFLMSAVALLKDNPAPTEDEVRRALSGNTCRCTGYQFIVDAVRAAGSEMAGSAAATGGR
jgi:aerobic carbon-monoxide dehydrogenase small subunit